MKHTLLFVALLLIVYACRKRGDASGEVNWPLNQSEQTQLIDSLLATQSSIKREEVRLFLRAFKYEQKLEIWLRQDGKEGHELLKTYHFCTSSGTLGPKRREGDFQIPEGVYHIDRFNPKSRFFLSLGLNYPNTSDRILGNALAPGSDIFIHGGCASVGCIPIRNQGIRELYLLAEQAKVNGQQKIPVHIFPYNFKNAPGEATHQEYSVHHTFWKDLKEIYQSFEQEKKLPLVKINSEGKYHIEQ